MSGERAQIPPVDERLHRPLWSVMIPTYNCADVLREALGSVLAQDPGPEQMQIEVVDDSSTCDNPEAVVRELGRGRVTFHRQPSNIGHTRNFESCLRRARGRLVHLLHGDDYVRVGFYARMEQGFLQPEVGAAVCRHIYMDYEGHWQSISPLERRSAGVVPDWLDRIAGGQRVATPSVVVRREVYEQLGGFDRRLGASEDWEMWVRIAAHHQVWFEPEPLAVYRMQRPGSVSATSAGRGRLAHDMRRATEVVESYLFRHRGPAGARQLTGRARRMYAGWALEAAAEGFAVGDTRGALAQLREALRCSRSSAVLLRALKVAAGGGGRRARFALRSVVGTSGP